MGFGVWGLWIEKLGLGVWSVEFRVWGLGTDD